MKLVYLKLYTSFRSLPQGFEMRFTNDSLPRLNPICLIGANGCGKSNVMELVCEIFYYLESIHLQYADRSLLTKKNYGFELEYDLPIDTVKKLWLIEKDQLSEKFLRVRIVKKKNQHAIFYLMDKKKEFILVTDRNDKIQILPKKIIGYSSGMNELISNPFVKLQYHYHHEYENKLIEEIYDKIEISRLFFMDYDSTTSLFLANFLIGDTHRLAPLREHLSIQNIHSFQIIIRLSDYQNKSIKLTPELQHSIELLKRCSTTYEETTVKFDVKEIVIDYFVNDETKKAFQHYFHSSFELFKVFYQLSLLNIYKVPKKIRKMIRQAQSGQTIQDYIPKPAKNQLVFSMENIKLTKKGISTPVYYKSLSDGEHQYLHIIGGVLLFEEDSTLFVLDEPETHFNPQWRSKLVSTLDRIANIEVEGELKKSRREQEFILSTHSPFILSDCHSENVFVFERDVNNNMVQTYPIKIETYGTSASVLYEEVFGKESLISDMALEEINKLKTQHIEELNDVERIRNEAHQFGESAEKFKLFTYLSRIQRELERE